MRRALSPVLVAVLGCATVAPREAPGGRAAPDGEAAAEGVPEADLPDTDAPPPQDAALDVDLAVYDFQARLAVRARSYLGRRGPFRAKGQRFGGDCSGYVEAVYAAEGLLLRELMQRDAPDERGGVKAAWYAARAHGRVFGPPEWPAPGDLVFWSDTYDRNRNGRADDRFTHLGIVEYVEDGTVHFLHRGAKGVARGVMTPGRPYEAVDADGRRLNSSIRAKSHPVKDGALAGALLEGYGRIDPSRIPAELASRHIDPFYGPAADREKSAPEAESAEATASAAATDEPDEDAKAGPPAGRGSTSPENGTPSATSIANATPTRTSSGPRTSTPTSKRKATAAPTSTRAETAAKKNPAAPKAAAKKKPAKKASARAKAPAAKPAATTPPAGDGSAAQARARPSPSPPSAPAR